MFAAAVLLSILGLFVGAALVSWTRGSRVTFAALDGATVGVVPGLVLLRLLPHLVEDSGAWALVGCAFGYLAFSAVESRAHRRATDIGIVIVLPALALHGFLDGAGLALAFQRPDVLGVGAFGVGAALILHKIPEGLFVASVFLPALGPSKTGVRVSLLAGATVLGALGGREALAHTPERLLHVSVALGLGVMLRMATHRHETAARSRSEQLASGLAFFGSLTALFVVPDPERLLTRAQPGELTALEALTPLLLETAPWLLLALLVGEWAARRPGDPNGDASARAGMWLPMIALSAPLLGPFFTLVRALVEPWYGAALLPSSGQSRTRVPSWAHRVLVVVERSAPPAKVVLPSYAVGIVLAVAVEAAVPGQSLDVGLVALPLVVGLALVVRIGAAGLTVVAAVLVHKGLPLPLALVLTAAAHAAGAPRPGGSPSTKVAALAVVGGAAAALHLVGPIESPPLHGLAAHPHPLVEWLAGGTITAWALFQLVTSGPRAWFAAEVPAPRLGDPVIRERP
jgi:uncharacterized protein